MVRGDRAVAAELKREGQEPTQAQYCWLQAMKAAGIEIHVWWPHSEQEWETVLR